MLESAARGNSGIGRIIGSVIAGHLGFAWGLAVFFVIPVIVAEGVGGFEAITRSSRVLKQRWGEAIIGTQGIGLIVFLATIIVAGIPIAIGVAALSAGTGVIGALFLSIGVAIALFMMAASTALDSTYRAVLYEYAKAGQAGGFSQDVLEDSFRPKDDLRGTGG